MTENWRYAAVAVLISGCADQATDEATSNWRVVENDAASGVNLVSATGFGEEIWASGPRFDEPWTTVVHLDGSTWDRLPVETDIVGFADVIGRERGLELWAPAEDELWLAGGDLWHWDGSSWQAVEVTGADTVEFTDVWGSSPTDVWASGRDGTGPGRLFHSDGSAWTEVEEWQVEELTPREPTEDGFSLHSGCSGGPDQVWLAVNIWYGLAHEAALVHFDGSTWTFEQPTGTIGSDAAIDAVTCDAGEVWAVGRNEGNGFVDRRSDGEWHEVPLTDSGAWRTIWARGGEAWTVGYESRVNPDDTLTRVPQIWRLSEQGSEAMLDGDLGLPSLAPRTTAAAALMAGWTTDSGRTFVFGVDGTILEYVP